MVVGPGNARPPQLWIVLRRDIHIQKTYLEVEKTVCYIAGVPGVYSNPASIKETLLTLGFYPSPDLYLSPAFIRTNTVCTHSCIPHMYTGVHHICTHSCTPHTYVHTAVHHIYTHRCTPQMHTQLYPPACVYIHNALHYCGYNCPISCNFDL